MSFWIKLFCLSQSNIFAAVKQGDLEKVKALLKGNPDLAFNSDSDSCTPLSYAAHWGLKEVEESPLANKADVNAKDNGGITPLHLAAESYKDVAELVLQRGGHE